MRLGSVSGLLRRGDVFVADRLTHMSSLDGAKLSNAKVVFFEHNDPNSLDEVLTRERAARKIVFLKAFIPWTATWLGCRNCSTSQKLTRCPYSSTKRTRYWLADRPAEASSSTFGAQDRVAIHMGSCSKAFSLLGGFVGGSRETIAYMRCYAHTYLFSAGLPPVLIGGTLAALEVAQREPESATKALG